MAEGGACPLCREASRLPPAGGQAALGAHLSVDICRPADCVACGEVETWMVTAMNDRLETEMYIT
jgi:hypothetical protein